MAVKISLPLTFRIRKLVRIVGIWELGAISLKVSTVTKRSLNHGEFEPLHFLNVWEVVSHMFLKRFRKLFRELNTSCDYFIELVTLFLYYN